MVHDQDLISGRGGVHRGVGVAEGGLDQLGNCLQLCYLVGVTQLLPGLLSAFFGGCGSHWRRLSTVSRQGHFDLYTGGLGRRRSSFSGMGAPPLLFSFLLACFFFLLFFAAATNPLLLLLLKCAATSTRFKL